ncbi:MAG: sigma-54-dependent Fis family transcriptional regulator [Spirochaetaceae bacterium]|nr:MAG: sigma-54-dependent Fis family transcriptional regulator [Spirochaetaceae bacterium]
MVPGDRLRLLPLKSARKTTHSARGLQIVGMLGYSEGTMANKPRVLLSFVGYRDPHPEGSEELGPLLSLLEAMEFDRVVLFCTGSRFLERARSVQEIVTGRDEGVTFSFVNLELQSVVDYEEIYLALRRATAMLLSGMQHQRPQLSVLLDPGTPQMQTSWFLLVRSGELDATLLQGIPPRFAGGVYKVKTVRLEDTALPEVRRPQKRGSQPTESVEPAPRAAGPDEWINSGGPQIVGRASLFRQLLESAARVAQYDVSVLIRGETGAGKGILARLVHQQGNRSSGPFLALNCSAISAGLAESELFGHIKGAFTGATTDRLGQFRAAQGGTVFLDEIGDLPPELQPKLLRVLEEKVVVPVGEERPCPVDVRIIAATNRNLEEMIEHGEFRRDLYERLNQTTLVLPPLRDRSEDIPPLIEKFLSDWNSRYHENKSLSPEAFEQLCAYPWPGNVRELENAVISMCAACRGDTAGVALLPPAVAAYARRRHGVPVAGAAGLDIELPPEGLNIRAVLSGLERSYYQQALERSGGNAEQAAALLGISGHAFRKAMRERFNAAE